MRPSRDFVVFVAIGGFSSFVNLASRVIFSSVTSYGLSIVLAFMVALTTAFILNRILIFKDSGTQWHGQLLRFLLVNLAALVLIYGVSMVLALIVFPAIGMTFYPETVAHGIALVCPIFVSYWAHQRFTFARRDAPSVGEG